MDISACPKGSESEILDILCEEIRDFQEIQLHGRLILMLKEL